MQSNYQDCVDRLEAITNLSTAELITNAIANYVDSLLAYKEQERKTETLKSGDEMKLWMVGRAVGEAGQKDPPYLIEGVFDTEDQAVAHCRDRNWFVHPLELNKALPDRDSPHPDCYYPMYEQEQNEG